MIEAGLTQSRRAAKVGIEPDPCVLCVFVPSCESIFRNHDSARSGYLGNNQFSEMQTTVSGSGTLIFYWEVSSETN
ncbi:MAG TPA: hypothetical protein VLI39_07040 [Sedimentisphaerales bacterium]|nr:hypothetical protein [Sedimentisphaerales bacterium]